MRIEGRGPIYFVRGIASYHVQDGLFSARMSLEPFVQFKDSLISNDNLMAFGYELMDILTGDWAELCDVLCVALAIGAFPHRHHHTSLQALCVVGSQRANVVWCGLLHTSSA